MSTVPRPDVFTTDELARAALVDPSRVRALLVTGELRFIPGTRYIAADDAVRVGRLLRQQLEITSQVIELERRRPALPATMSGLVHAAVIAVLLVLHTGTPETATVDEVRETPRLVFIMSPGPGGGGGGGGLRNPLPAPKVQRRAERPTARLSVPVVAPKPVATTARREEAPKAVTPVTPPVVTPPVVREPDPLPSRVLVAPVVAVAADPGDREGVIEKGRGDATSQGSGVGGGAGSGQGTGNGEGQGAGIGDGAGGGTGGGPFRPGSGIDPPRIVREVKPTYTEEARRRGLQGDVLLEIVVLRDGAVGQVTLLQGLGAGLDQRAIEAIRQWRFAPAQRRGVPVDVIVEVAVEFTLR
jgi:TonB family protein